MGLKIGTKLVEAVSGLANNVGNAFDKNFANKAEQLSEKAKILELIRNIQALFMQLQKELIALELSGNWLQRSWRPILMLCFGAIVVYAYFVQPAFFPNQIHIRTDLTPEFWQLLKIGVGGYVTSRGVEKVAKIGAEAYKTRKERNRDIPENND